VQHIIVIVVVAVAYAALAAISAAVAYSPADSWTVWLSSGVVLGLLLALRRSSWAAVLAGGFIGATGFAFYLRRRRRSHRLWRDRGIRVGCTALIVSRLTSCRCHDRARASWRHHHRGALPLA
jgi:hypothetical protein